eukprot:TRINITY_DN24291_c0_g1_i1.p1 TRINITY_DN24291_c0_g1~~TRINITY_DN24291_c0_g1_i1.p1  ORF type:complete len:489 (-),score=73.27 TRINITY_DN24291_c0_g1_i1:465-1931(-)
MAEVTGRTTMVDVAGCPDMDASMVEVSAKSASQRQAVIVCSFVASTGLFHGYDNGVVSYLFTMPAFRHMMGWPVQDDSSSALSESWIVSAFNLAAALTAVIAGHALVDRYGRRPSMMLGSVLFALGGALQGFAFNPAMLISGRAVAGIGVGITSSSTPAYISEVAPEKIRATLVGIYQSNVCLAIILAMVLNCSVHDTSTGWRVSLGLQLPLGAVVAIRMFCVGETPRFLESIGKPEEALSVLTKLRGGDKCAASQELQQVKDEIEKERQAGNASWTEIFTNPFYRNVVIIGCFMQFFQIATGINAVVSFSGTLFTPLGINGIFAAVSPSVAFFLGNAIGGFVLADRLGRRPLLIWGMTTMCFSMLAGGTVALVASECGAQEIGHLPGRFIICMVMIYEFAFGVSWGFGAWLYISEIMPLRVRGKAVGLCTAVNWGPANFLTAFLTPHMIASSIGPGGTLLFYGCVSLLVIPFAATCLPRREARHWRK